MDVLLQVLVLLLLVRVLGELAERLGQSASVGELGAGILLAALVPVLGDRLPFLQGLRESDVLRWLAELGIFFLVLMAGIEMRPREIATNTRGGLAVALGGMVLPLAAGYGLAMLFLPPGGSRSTLALVVGVAMSITAIPATLKVLTDFGVLHRRIGETVVAAAIFDDILGLLLLAVLTAVMKTGQVPDAWALGLLLLKVAAFFAITVTLGVHVYPRVSERLRQMEAAALEFSALVAVALAYGSLAEWLGMHWILGAFMAGLYFESPRVGRRAYADMKLVFTAISNGLLAPFFFLSIGLGVDLSVVAAAPLLLALLILVAFLGKVVGAGLPALWIGFDRHAALAIGIGMTSRGAVELVVLGIAAEAGVFAGSDRLFSALVLMAVVNTLLMPLLLRRALGSRRTGEDA